jgi:hypothetical protein
MSWLVGNWWAIARTKLGGDLLNPPYFWYGCGERNVDLDAKKKLIDSAFDFTIIAG